MEGAVDLTGAVVERWLVAPGPGSGPCLGCRFLQGLAFFAGEGPMPPLHPECRCWRVPVGPEGLAEVAKIRLALEARANGRAAAALVEEARRRAIGKGGRTVGDVVRRSVG